MITSILGALFLVVSATPAQAHETLIQYGQSSAYVGPGHTKIIWCDSPADSSAVRAWYYTTNNRWHATNEAWFTCGEKQTDHHITAYCLEVIGVAILCRET